MEVSRSFFEEALAKATSKHRDAIGGIKIVLRRDDNEGDYFDEVIAKVTCLRRDTFGGIKIVLR